MTFADKVQNFLCEVRIGVVSSLAADGTPQSAVVGVTPFIESGELMLGTSVETRKYHNIKANPRVSIAMWQGSITIQAEGEVDIIERADPRFSEYQDRIIQIDPSKQRFAGDSSQIWMIFKPNWVRYTDIATKPWVVEETKH